MENKEEIIMMQEKPRKNNGIRISSMTLCLGKGDNKGDNYEEYTIV